MLKQGFSEVLPLIQQLRIFFVPPPPLLALNLASAAIPTLSHSLILE